MAKTGQTNQPEVEKAYAAELDAWYLWNLVAPRGRVWDCGDGSQAVCLFNDVFLLAKPEENSGWGVEFLSTDELWSRYQSDEDVYVIGLTVADSPYVLCVNETKS